MRKDFLKGWKIWELTGVGTLAIMLVGSILSSVILNLANIEMDDKTSKWACFVRAVDDLNKMLIVACAIMFIIVLLKRKNICKKFLYCVLILFPLDCIFVFKINPERIQSLLSNTINKAKLLIGLLGAQESAQKSATETEAHYPYFPWVFIGIVIISIIVIAFIRYRKKTKEAPSSDERRREQKVPITSTVVSAESGSSQIDSAETIQIAASETKRDDSSQNGASENNHMESHQNGTQTQEQSTSYRNELFFVSSVIFFVIVSIAAFLLAYNVFYSYIGDSSNSSETAVNETNAENEANAENETSAESEANEENETNAKSGNQSLTISQKVISSLSENLKPLPIPPYFYTISLVCLSLLISFSIIRLWRALLSKGYTNGIAMLLSFVSIIVLKAKGSFNGSNNTPTNDGPLNALSSLPNFITTIAAFIIFFLIFDIFVLMLSFLLEHGVKSKDTPSSKELISIDEIDDYEIKMPEHIPIYLQARTLRIEADFIKIALGFIEGSVELFNFIPDFFNTIGYLLLGNKIKKKKKNCSKRNTKSKKQKSKKES